MTGFSRMHPGVMVALLPLALGLAATSSSPAVAQTSTHTVDARVLVLSTDGSETTLPAIKQALDYIGVPYTVYTARATPGGLTAAKLFSGTHAFYQGVILTYGALPYSPDGGKTWSSALTSQEWQTLWTYEAAFSVREVSWFIYPTPDDGYTYATTATSNTLNAQFTPAAQSIFPYVNTANPLAISNAYIYFAHQYDATSTPLLVDGQGDVLATIKNYPDGRQELSLTFDSNQYLTHHLVLSYGLINWVTRGLFLGQRHIYLAAQVDDLFLEDDIWTGAPESANGVDPGPSNSNSVYRMTDADLQAVINWQKAKNTQPITKSFVFDWAFNGVGTTGQYSPDPLTPALKQNQALFRFISHTWDHTELDNLTYAQCKSEISQNNKAAKDLKLTNFSTTNMVTPSISGLNNPNFMKAAFDQGLRYLVSDTSVAGYNNPSPNAGIYNPYQPAILEIPRHPVNLYYNVSTPAEWTSEYNYFYRSYFGYDLTYQQLLDRIAGVDLLPYLLRGDLDPLMFHQPNLRAYDGIHTLLGDLMDNLFARYTSLFNLPIQCLSQDAIGQQMAQRMQYNAAGLTASFVPGQSITIHATRAATVPVTGLKTTGAELYGGQYISYIKLNAGQTVTIPLS